MFDKLKGVMRVTEKGSGDIILTNSDWYAKRPDEYTIEENPTLDATDIATWLDGDAENANYHNLVGAHEWLAEILIGEAGEEVALKVMHIIAARGGLHESF